MNQYITSTQNPIETVHYEGLTVKLLASGDGTEIIHHTLKKGARWSMQPQEGSTVSETLYMLKGSMKVTIAEETKVLHVGDTFSASPIDQVALFTATEETEFFYVSSQPVFHYFSEILKEHEDIAIQVALKDGYTAEHCRRIMLMAMKIGEKMGLSPVELTTLNYASYLHDVGKIKIPKSLLLKKGPLTEEEWEEMKRHCEYGRELLDSTGNPFLQSAAKIVVQHHERYDGKGYPSGLKGKEISPLASIISVVDAFDAMTTDRPYRKALNIDVAKEELIKNKGTMFHPDVVDVFIQQLESK